MMETALARASLYNFLAAAFGDLPTPELMATAKEVLPNVAPAPLDEVCKAYTRLLIGPGAGYAPPYASVYLDPPLNGKPQLWGPAAIAVDSIYREADLEIAPGQPRVPDHLALELQFMQHLCARQAEAQARGKLEEAARWRERQHTFLHDHLWPWLPRFAERAAEAGTHPVYQLLVEFTVSFVQSEINLPEGVASSGG